MTNIIVTCTDGIVHIKNMDKFSIYAKNMLDSGINTVTVEYPAWYVKQMIDCPDTQVYPFYLYPLADYFSFTHITSNILLSCKLYYMLKKQLKHAIEWLIDEKNNRHPDFTQTSRDIIMYYAMLILKSNYDLTYEYVTMNRLLPLLLEFNAVNTDIEKVLYMYWSGNNELFSDIDYLELFITSQFSGYNRRRLFDIMDIDRSSMLKDAIFCCSTRIYEHLKVVSIMKRGEKIVVSIKCNLLHESPIVAVTYTSLEWTMVEEYIRTLKR